MKRDIQALVIGNGAYSSPLTLNSPVTDAKSVDKCLKRLGVQVILGTDLSYNQIKSAVDEFLTKVNLPSTNVSLLYYSGHGLQLSDENYILPVDFDQSASENVANLVSIQSIVDSMSNATAIRIVLLDACRTSRSVREFVGGKGIRTEKAIFVNDKLLPPSGLAEMKANSDTFIAFAAAPGEVALEGSSLSPFTEAFLNQLEVVDLPLSNLTSRVRQEVLHKTGGRQRTWDQASLTRPFYFSPGSLFFFTGYLLAILALIFATVIFSLVLREPTLGPAWIFAAAALPFSSLAVLLLAGQEIYSRLRGDLGWGESPSSAKRYAGACLRRGLIGGYLGSLVAALPLSIPFYNAWHNPTVSLAQLVLEITFAAASAACGLGFLCTFFARASFRSLGLYLISNASNLRSIVGSLAGGCIAGILLGPLVTLYFLPLNRPWYGPKFLLPGGILGAAFIVFSIISFDFERLNGRRLWVAGASSFLAVIVGLIAIVVLGLVSTVIVELIDFDTLYRFRPVMSLWTIGAVYGIVVGLVLGLVIGIAIVLTERWSKRPVLV
jgi:Caspase domain